MSEWWTYRLSSFLLFSPRTYYRLFELYNEAIWPAQLVALALGGAILALSFRGGAQAARLAAAILAGLWLFVALAFHGARYATINWAATWFAAGFAIEAALLVWAGTIRSAIILRPRTGLAARAGLAMFLFALLVEPLLGPLLGRKWSALELFGLAPDPTAVATLGLVLAGGRPSWFLLAIPLVWCAVSGATLWTIEAPDAFVLPLAAALAVLLAAAQTAEGLPRRLFRRPMRKTGGTA
jgi:hypothetical protein